MYSLFETCDDYAVGNKVKLCSNSLSAICESLGNALGIILDECLVKETDFLVELAELTSDDAFLNLVWLGSKLLVLSYLSSEDAKLLFLIFLWNNLV